MGWINTKPAKRPRMGLRDPNGGRYRSDEYRAWVRGRPCLIEGKNGHVCVPTRAAAHVRTGTDGCTSEKPSDFWCVSLCDDYMGVHGKGAHNEQHRLGEKAFEKKYGVDLKAAAQQYWNSGAHSHKRKYERKHPTTPIQVGTPAELRAGDEDKGTR